MISVAFLPHKMSIGINKDFARLVLPGKVAFERYTSFGFNSLAQISAIRRIKQSQIIVFVHASIKLMG